MFSTEIIIDADYGATGWEIVARFTPEDMIAAWSDMDHDGLRATAHAIGETIANALINDLPKED